MKSKDGFTIETVAAGATAFTPVALVVCMLMKSGMADAAGWVLGIGVFGGMAVAAKIETALKQVKGGA